MKPKLFDREGADGGWGWRKAQKATGQQLEGQNPFQLLKEVAPDWGPESRQKVPGVVALGSLWVCRALAPL
jgi:hypothetical protein